MGLVVTPWALLIVPVAVLVAFTFAAVGMACATFLRSPSQFDFVQLALMPLFLFSATFYPLTVYPPGLRIVVECSPLYHGVELMRGLSSGVLSFGMFGHVAYLLALACVGLYVTSRRLGSLLLR
jgi:lipooligosaccharide transport system permease protein